MLTFIGVVLFVAGIYGLVRGKVAGPIDSRGKSALLLLAAFIVEGIRGATGSPSAPPSTAAKTTAPVSAPAPTPTAPKDPPKPVYNYTVTVDGVKYQGKTSSDVGVAVISTKTASTLGSQYFQKKAQGQYLMVQVAISNHQKDAIMLSSGSFKVLANGKEYSDSTDGQIALGSDNGALIFDELNPDLTKLGWLVFDVPPTIDAANAQLQFSGGMMGKREVVPLVPIKE